MKVDLKKLIPALLLPLAVGLLSALITSGAKDFYSTIHKPPFAPPGFLFPIVWTILYLLMGVSSYLVVKSDSEKKPFALLMYYRQLFFNFLWPLIFFNAGAFLPALIILVILWIIVFLMIRAFYAIKPLAGLLQIPYLIWLTYAGYLNLAVFLLNR